MKGINKGGRVVYRKHRRDLSWVGSFLYVCDAASCELECMGCLVVVRPGDNGEVGGNLVPMEEMRKHGGNYGCSGYGDG